MFNSQSKIFNLKSSGFSLIEAMAAVLIIVIGMVGVLSLVAQNIKVQNINKNELIASQLAQEGLEIYRWRRDDSLRKGQSWSDFKSSYVDDWVMDYRGAMDPLSSNPTAKLYINTSGFYEYNSAGISTIFSRFTKVTDNGDYLDVRCTVQWQERGNTKQYVASTLLYDWR